MSAGPISRGDDAVRWAGGILAGFLVAYLLVLVRINRVSEGADTPAWFWAFLLNVAALVVGGACCFLRRPRYRSVGIGLLVGFALPNVGFVIGALQ